jgi:hypothetical protein
MRLSGSTNVILQQLEPGKRRRADVWMDGQIGGANMGKDRGLV